MSTELDLTKPVQTKDGAQVEILDTQLAGFRPVLGVVTSSDGRRTVGMWYRTGRRTGAGVNPEDLINIPEKKTIYVNLYPDNWGCHYASREEADHAADSSREACIKLSYTVGQFDD